MGEPESPVERVGERAHRLATVTAAQRELRQLDVDVGELPPHEALERCEVLAEEIALDESRALGDHGLGPREDPARLLAGGLGTPVDGALAQGVGVLVELREHEPADVPELVAEVTCMEQLRI